MFGRALSRAHGLVACLVPSGSWEDAPAHCLAFLRAVSNRQDLDFSYTLTDRIVRLSLGELADFSGARYDGDFTISLEEAQQRKYEFIAEQIGIREGRRVLDVGCGWGPVLNFIRDRGGVGVGVTLSSGHEAACRRHGFEVHLYDARQIDRETFGPFDGVTGLGLMEHICSPEELSLIHI